MIYHIMNVFIFLFIQKRRKISVYLFIMNEFIKCIGIFVRYLPEHCIFAFKIWNCSEKRFHPADHTKQTGGRSRLILLHFSEIFVTAEAEYKLEDRSQEKESDRIAYAVSEGL